MFTESFTNSTTRLPETLSFEMLKIKQCNLKKKEGCYPSLLANTECAVELWEIILPDKNVSQGK